MPATKPSTPPRGLTPKSIAALKPAEVEYDVPDRRAPGLVLRVLPKSGRRVFRWYCSSRRRVITIGPWAATTVPGHVTLGEAHTWLDRLKAAHKVGELDAVEAELRAHLRRRASVTDPAPDDPNRRLFSKVAEEFYQDRIVRSRKRPEDARAILDRDLLPTLGPRPLEAITTLECRDVVKRTIARGAPVHAGKVLATLKQLFAWAQSNGFTDRNPAAPLRALDLGVEVNVSRRCLDDPFEKYEGEIAAFWRALDAAVAADRPEAQKLRPATAAALKLLLLTGVRSGELLKARWENVDLERATWTIPITDQKLTRAQERQARPFVIPLPPTALALFQELRELARDVKVPDEDGEDTKGSPWVMASPESDEGHYTDKALGRAMRRLFKAPVKLKLAGGEASPHDLRRTMRTHLGQTLRVPPHIAERCLNHSLGRIAKTYDQGDYLDERREALEKWEAYVARLLSPATSKVAFLPVAAVAP